MLKQILGLCLLLTACQATPPGAPTAPSTQTAPASPSELDYAQQMLSAHKKLTESSTGLMGSLGINTGPAPTATDSTLSGGLPTPDQIQSMKKGLVGISAALQTQINELQALQPPASFQTKHQTLLRYQRNHLTQLQTLSEKIAPLDTPETIMQHILAFAAQVRSPENAVLAVEAENIQLDLFLLTLKPNLPPFQASQAVEASIFNAHLEELRPFLPPQEIMRNVMSGRPHIENVDTLLQKWSQLTPPENQQAIHLTIIGFLSTHKHINQQLADSSNPMLISNAELLIEINRSLGLAQRILVS
jgi:hypothetical protein